MRIAHIQEGIEQSRNVAAEQQRRKPSFIGLKRQGHDVAHQPHVFTDIFGQAVIRPLHSGQVLAALLGAIACLLFIIAHTLDFLFDFADTC